MNRDISTYTIDQLFDIDQLKQFLEYHHLMSGMGCALLDNDENTLVSIGHQEICARFHHVHPVCSKQCRGRLSRLKADRTENDYIEYRCGNGMIDVAIPIRIQGHLIATFYSGQFFYDDDPPDRDYFYNKALELGYDPAEYLTALAHVPLFSREHVRSKLMGLCSITKLLSESGLKYARLEKDRRNAKLAFFANLDAVNRAIQGTNDPQQMMNDVLDVVRSVLNCDRAFLMYPCDPDAEVLDIQIESTTPEHPGVKALGGFLFQEKSISQDVHALLNTDEPVAFGCGSSHEISGTTAKRFAIKSILGMAIHPKIGKPWVFGIHQCTYDRVWSPDEKRFVKEVGRRLGDALTMLLTHQALQESEARYRHSSNLLSSVLESATVVGVFALDRKYRYLAFNRRHRERMKFLWDKDIAIGMNMFDAVSVKYRAEIRQLCDQVLKGESVSADLQFHIVKDGREVSAYYENHGSPIVNDNGEVVGLTFFAINITERKHMETELFQREQQFRTLAENSPGMIVRYDRECKRIYVNPAFTQKSHIQAADALRTTPADFWMKPANITPDEYIAVLQKVMNTGEPGEILFECPDPETGQFSFHHFHIVAEKNGNGDILGCLAIDHDITSLKEAQLKLDRLVEIFPGVLCTFCMRPDGGFSMSYASHRIKELLGLTFDELHHDMSKVFSWVHPDDYERHMNSIFESSQTLLPWHLEFRILHPGKGDVWVEGHCIPKRQPDGSTLWYGCIHDITGRKLSEEALEKKRRQLAELSSELSLAEERERKNIAAMLHDHIGQTLLLGRIKLGALAVNTIPKDQQKTVAEIKDLLDQVTLDIHKLTVQLSPPILATAGLEAALEWLGRRMEEDYGLFVEFEDDLRMKPLKEEVRSVVYQCARELLINVAKHAKTDHARIVVARDGNHFCLTVEDDGFGFDPAMLEHDSSKDLSFGLLSIQIRMERLGGGVIYESSPGHGSRMTLLSPLSKTDIP